MTAFGAIVLPTTIEAAVLDGLKTWMDTYLREIERITHRSGGALPSIADWAAASATDQRLPEQQLPGIQVTWSDMALTRHGNDVSARVPFSIEVLVQSTDFNSARELASLYGFALSLICVQKIRSHPLISSVSTPQLAIPVVSGAERRWRAVATVAVTIDVNAVADTLAGPTEVAPDPTPIPPDTPTVTEVDVDGDLELPAPAG